MSCVNPSPETRFGAIRGNMRGRVSTKWLREELELPDPETGESKSQSIARHLIELATSYTVIHCGRNLELASGRDSVEAAKILFQYCYGKPPPSVEEQTLQLAEHFRQVARDSVDLALKVLGDRISTMKPEEVAAGLQAFSVNPRGFLDAARECVNGSSVEKGARELAPDNGHLPGQESQGSTLPSEPANSEGQP